jgi:hypothetical protein
MVFSNGYASFDNRVIWGEHRAVLRILFDGSARAYPQIRTIVVRQS